MSADVGPVATSKKVIWAGRVMSTLPVLMLMMSGYMKLAKPPEMTEGMAHLGWPMSLALVLAVLELGSTLLYVIPQTAVLGAVVLTGYLGGAIATHLRIGEVPHIALIVGLGVLVWGGLFLRDARVRALIPIRRLK